jgi:gamma-polyglutamate synthase
VMGSQNIKGTGLDFVYRWLQVDRAAQQMDRARTTPSARGEVLAWVLSHADWGLYDIRATLASLLAFKEHAEWSPHAPMLDKAIARMTALAAEKRAALKSTGKAGVFARFLGRVERFVDHLDSVRRTAAARRILADLYAGRLGHGRAAILMRDVVGRGKGGWLMKDIRKWNERRLARKATPKKPDPPG